MPASEEGRAMSQDMLDIERKVARCRILLSLFALAAIYLDPITPIVIGQFGSAGGPLRVDARALSVLGAHLGYSLAVLASLSIGLVPRGIVTITTGADVLFGAVIALFAQGVSSPFYVFFAFAVIAAGARGGFRFGIGVTSVSIWLYLSLILVSATGPTQLHTYIMGPAYLAIVGYLVAYLGRLRLNLESKLAALERAKERNEIARALHDGCVQTLAGTNLTLGSCQELVRRGPGHPDPHRRRRPRLRRRRGRAVVDLVARRPARRAGPAGARQPCGRAPGHRAAHGVKGEGMETPLRIAIADDHALFRQGLKSQLRLQPGLVVVGEVDRADQLAAMIAATPCDILLLDLQMERSALVDIKGLAERVTVIVVTASERAEDALAAIRSGARAVVFKRFAIETLMDAIAAVVEGNVWMPPALQRHLTARLTEPPEEPLTPREIEIVRQVAMGLRNAEVAEHLSISEVTVKTHLNNIFQKLGLRGRTALALYAIRMGIVGVPDGNP